MPALLASLCNRDYSLHDFSFLKTFLSLLHPPTAYSLVRIQLPFHHQLPNPTQCRPRKGWLASGEQEVSSLPQTLFASLGSGLKREGERLSGED